MADEIYLIEYKDIVEALLKKHNIHEGIWGIYVEFKFKGIYAAGEPPKPGEIPQNVSPACVVGLNKIGIHRLKEESNLAFDAAKLNPAQPAKKSRSK